MLFLAGRLGALLRIDVLWLDKLLQLDVLPRLDDDVMPRFDAALLDASTPSWPSSSADLSLGDRGL